MKPETAEQYVDMLLPIKPLLRAINEPHRYGLDIDED